MKKYDKYKPSGIEWIGEVPEGWKKCRFKNFITLISKATTGGYKIGLENIESGSGKFLTIDNEFDGDGVEFKIDDIVYGKLRPYLMKVWVAEFVGNAVGDFFIFRVKNNASPQFIKYLMLSDGFTKETNGATEGAKMPRVSSDFILTLKYFLPSKVEQTAIAAYLDDKCAKIDNVVSTQQKRIELLKELKQSIITNAVTKGLDKTAKMKDSGIEWIGEVPEGWRIIPTLFSLSMPITDGPHESPQLYDNGIPFISAEAITSGEIIFDNMRGYISQKYYEECCKKYVPQKYDVYMIKSGATTGRTAIVRTDDTFTIWSPLAVFRANKEKILPFFLLYVLRSNYYLKQVETSWSYGTQQNIGMRVLEKLKIALPSLTEQTDIVSYLDKKCATIDRQIAKIEKQIELLKEYKQSVITECVTGKRKVC